MASEQERLAALDKLHDAIAEFARTRPDADDENPLADNSHLTHFIVVTNWDEYNVEGAQSAIAVYASDMAPFMRLGLLNAGLDVIDVVG